MARILLQVIPPEWNNMSGLSILETTPSAKNDATLFNAA